ncbi:Class I glutamine amidotransferase-like superfamily protein [Euphorbia peplus]|nr:Class I glutamine amidotransferase-like superfamily protein [Euphorbia peplus]
MEVLIIVGVLRRAGADVTVASLEPHLEIEASGGTRLTTYDKRGPSTSSEFALCLAEQLFGESVAIEVAQLLLMLMANDTLRREEFNEVEWSLNHKSRVSSHSLYGLLILQGETSGAKRLQKSKLPKKLPKEQDGAGRIHGDVCSSATVLQSQDFLKDRKATTHPSVVSRLTDDVENDHEQGTCCRSRFFAMAIISKLFGHARARRVAEGLVFGYPRT